MDDLDLGATIKGFSAGQKVFNRYTLKKILGRGGMGVVWLAQDGELEREVALKFLPEIVALDPEALADLKRETRRNLDLTHSHIVRIHDFVSDRHTAAIAMEYVNGATLSALKLEKAARVFTPAEIRAWLGQLTEALTYAHNKAKVVHRDLKPANLMITRDGELKITDFGIARGISDSVSRVSAQAGGTSGTPLYMSPQQMMGEKPAVTDDVYSLGATLYELLTGKPPFYSGNVVLQVQTKPVPSMVERRRELEVTGEPVPDHWVQAIEACLAKEPKDRPQSIAELGQRLGLHGSPVVPPPAAVVASVPPSPVAPAPVATGAPPALSRRVLALAGSALLWAVLGVGLILLWVRAGQNFSDQWEAWWRWVEYPVLGVWIAVSVGLIRWSAGSDFAKGPWLGFGTALLAADITFSELMTPVLASPRADDVLLVAPSLLGLGLAGVGLFCFRAKQPIGLSRIVTSMWAGWGCGAVASAVAKLPVLPAALESHLVRISFPVWVVMGSLTWLCLLSHQLGSATPSSEPKPSPRQKLLAGLGLLLLALVVLVTATALAPRFS